MTLQNYKIVTQVYVAIYFVKFVAGPLSQLLNLCL